MANETIAVPPELAAKAQEKGWPLDLVQQALAMGAGPAQIISYMDRGVTAEQARQIMAQQAGAGPAAAPPAAAQPGAAVEPSDEIKAKAEEKDWPLDLVRRALAAGGTEADLMNYMDMGVTAAQAEEFMAQGGGPQLDLSWMDTPTEWNTRAKVTKHGLTLEALNIGTYGVIPDHWPYKTEMPRGAVPIEGTEGMGYSIYEKQEVWSNICAALYEEAIQRRWRPATDVPWGTIEPLPDDLERAIGQICTYLSEKAQMHGDVIGRWEPEISYGYHEVKLYLATSVFEDARAVEVFRKRALSNGGGLGLQSPGWAFRSVVDSRNFTEMAVLQFVLQDSLTLAEYAFGEKYAKNPAEKYIFGHALQDKSRIVAYGIDHLKYVLLNRADRREEIQRYLDKGEGILAIDDRKDNATPAAWAIYFGGSKENIKEGMQVYRQMRKTFVRQYLDRLKWATLERAERLEPSLKAYLEA